MQEDAFDSSKVSAVPVDSSGSGLSLDLRAKACLIPRTQGKFRRKSLAFLKGIDILRIDTHEPSAISEGAEELVGGCGGLDIVANLLTETRDEHVKDRCCKGIGPDHRVKEVASFEVG